MSNPASCLGRETLRRKLSPHHEAVIAPTSEAERGYDYFPYGPPGSSPPHFVARRSSGKEGSTVASIKLGIFYSDLPSLVWQSGLSLIGTI